jgi:hypothetical protein
MAREQAIKNTVDMQAKNKTYYDAQRVDKTFLVGQLVTIPNEKRKNKLSQIRNGPYRIIKAFPNGLNYRLRFANSPNAKPFTVHVRRLEPYIERSQFPAFRLVPQIGEVPSVIPPKATSIPTTIPQLSTESNTNTSAANPSAPVNNSDINVPTDPISTQQKDPMQLLKSTLTSMLQTYSTKPNFDVSAAKKILTIMLDTGSLYITSFKRNEYYRKKIRSFKTQDDVMVFLKSATNDFDIEFAHEITRGSN